jgi:hypothetical protein
MAVPPPVVAPAPKGKRRKGLIVLGLVLLVGGVLGGGAMVAKSASNYEDAVKSLARAPVGCTTTLVFDEPATYTIYIETKGTLGELSGDCEASGAAYDFPGDKLPKVALTLVDGNGDELELQRGVTASYDVGGYAGTAVRTVKIEQAGTYRLNVESDDSGFAISIGKNPKDDSELLKTIGGATALAGFVLGLTFLLIGLRRRRPETAVADVRSPVAPLPGWSPGPYPPAPTAPPAPPGFGPAPPPAAQPIGLPGQPPIRLPEQPPVRGGFAPPSLAPPPPPSAVPTLPTLPPTAITPSLPPTVPPPAPPTVPPSAPPDSWTVDDDDD